MNRTLVALAGIAAFLVVAFFGYQLISPRLNRCEAIFQQTAPSLETNFKFLESEGGVVLGSTQMQALSDRATEIAINLKTCCVMAGDKSDSLAQFNECKATAVLYEQQVTEAVDVVRDVVDASAAERLAEQQRAGQRLTEIIEATKAASETLKRQAEEISQEQPASGQATQPGQLRVKALLSEGGEEIAGCIYVNEPEPDIQGNRKQIDYACAPNHIFTLPPGEYIVTAAAGDASTAATLTVAGGKLTDRALSLDAGYLRPRAALAPGGEEPSSCFYINEPKPDIQGNHRRINYACQKDPVFTLPAGDYLVGVSSGDVSTSTLLKVAAGQITDHSFDLNAGYLRTRAALTAGGEAISACFYVQQPKERLDGTYPQINYGCQDNVVFTLPAGEYRVAVTAGDVSAVANLAVRAGDVTDQFFSLNAGYLRARAVAAGGDDAANACIYIYHPKPDLLGNKPRINYTCSPGTIFTLPAGTYHVDAEAELAKASAQPEVRPGELTDLVLTLSATP